MDAHLIFAPVFVSYKVVFLLHPVANILPSGENRTQHTTESCISVCTSPTSSCRLTLGLNMVSQSEPSLRSSDETEVAGSNGGSSRAAGSSWGGWGCETCWRGELTRGGRVWDELSECEEGRIGWVEEGRESGRARVGPGVRWQASQHPSNYSKCLKLACQSGTGAYPDPSLRGRHPPHA